MDNRDYRIRTCGLCFPKAAFYQAELSPVTSPQSQGVLLYVVDVLLAKQHPLWIK